MNLEEINEDEIEEKDIMKTNNIKELNKLIDKYYTDAYGRISHSSSYPGEYRYIEQFIEDYLKSAEDVVTYKMEYTKFYSAVVFSVSWVDTNSNLHLCTFLVERW